MKKTLRDKFNRRNVLRLLAGAAGAAVGLPVLVPDRALGLSATMAPSERITLGFIGVGMMGQGHVRVCAGYDQTQILAVCDVDQWRRDTNKARVEEAYATRTNSGRYRGCDTYNDLRDLLARADIDAVVIATGDNWHGNATVMAAKAGKDIYCEKPISKTIYEARTMVAHVHRYGRVSQIGLQQRSAPQFHKACDLVRRGRIGEVKTVYVIFSGTSGDVNLPPQPVPEGLDWNQWLGPAPWRPFNGRYHIYGKPPHVVPWQFSRDFGGGNLTSNTVHAFDVVQWGLGMDESGPVEITPPVDGENPNLTYKYANGVLVHVVDQKLKKDVHRIPKGWDVNRRIENFGAVFVGDEGWIHVGRGGYLTGYPEGILDAPTGETESPHPVTPHHQNWFDCIRSRQRAACDVAIGCRSTIVSHLGCIAHWTGRSLRWDPQKEEFAGDEDANRLRTRTMRAPWQV
ncbi:MAG: Gfo/Idh/MocA family protein [Pirellulaceae bacterium]